MIQQKDLDYLFSLKNEDINKNLLIDLFANTSAREARFKTTEKIIIPKGIMKNEKEIETTVGRFIFNKFILEPHLLDLIGYFNVVIDGKGIKKLDGEVSSLLLEGKIDTDVFIDYLNKIHWLAFVANAFLCSSTTYNLIKPNTKVMARKNQLIKEKMEALKNNDVIETTKIEKELVSMAREELKDDPGMDLYNSGAKGSFDNTYKNTSIMKGSQINTAGTGYFSTFSNYMDGVTKEEYNIFANALIYGQYSKSVSPAISGYLSKQYFSSFQSLVIDKADTDCKTTETLKILLTDNDSKFFLYRYMIENNKLILLTPDIISSYVNKVINLRSPLFCQSEKFCSRCMGDLFYRLDIKNVGLTSSKIGSTMLKGSMKKFHNTTIELHRIDFSKYFSE